MRSPNNLLSNIPLYSSELACLPRPRCPTIYLTIFHVVVGGQGQWTEECGQHVDASPGRRHGWAHTRKLAIFLSHEQECKF